MTDAAEGSADPEAAEDMAAGAAASAVALAATSTQPPPIAWYTATSCV